jgi:hypothetical protein
MRLKTLMPMTKHKPNLLRETSRRAIVEALEKSSFIRHNFTAEFEDLKDKAALVVVSFVPNESYFFKLSKSSSYPGEPRFATMECPGKELGEAFRYERNDFPECLDALEGWVKRIVEDCRHASPLFDDLRAFQEALRQEMARHINNPQPHSTQAVAPDLQARLDALGRRLENLEQQCDVAARKLEQFEARLTEFAEGANGSAHASWFKPTGAKIVG